MNLILGPKNCIDRRLQIFLSWIMQWKELNLILLFSVFDFSSIQNYNEILYYKLYYMTKSNAIGYHQPSLSSNSTV